MYKNFNAVIEKTRYYKSCGYQIRLPGGTSLDGKINSIIVPIIVDANGTVFVTVIPYELNANLIKKDKEYEEELAELIGYESPKKLAIRKLKEEVGFISKEGYLKEILPPHSVKDNRFENTNESHKKYSFYVVNFTGKFIDQWNKSLLTVETKEPYWFPLSLLGKYIFYNHKVYFEALKEIFLNTESKKYYKRQID